MTWLRTSALIAFLALSQGCASGLCLDPRKLAYTLSAPDDLVVGNKGRLVTRVKNRTEYFMLVEHVMGTDVAKTDEVILWGTRKGRLEKDGGSSVRFVPGGETRTSGVFAYGLIPPGQQLRIEVELTPGQSNGLLEVHYRGLTLEEASKVLFFRDLSVDEAGVEVYRNLPPSLLSKLTAPGEDEFRSPEAIMVVMEEQFARTRPFCRIELPYRFPATPPE